MNPKDNPYYKRRLQELESHLDPKTSWQSVEIKLQQFFGRHVNSSESETSIVKQVSDWFNRLSRAGKVAVVAIAAIIGFSVLKSLLQLVASLFTLALFGVILYLVYKFFVAPQSAK